MESTTQWDDEFDALLRKAFREVHEREMAAIPPKEVLDKMYTLSERHKARMKALLEQADSSQE